MRVSRAYRRWYAGILSKLDSCMPQSMVARTLWFTLLSVILAQTIAATIWYSHSKDRELAGLKSASTSMAHNFSSTVTFFQSLPYKYRHIVLEQLRNIGGTRFFVSFNKELIEIDSVPINEMKQAVIEVFDSILTKELPGVTRIEIDFSWADNLHVLSNDILLKDLPKSWAHYSLTLEPLSLPILVVQIELATNQWLYIAALLPSPYAMLENEILSSHQIFFISFITALLMLFTYFMVRRQVKPLNYLAQAANALSIDIDQPPLVECGASELVSATQAFNRMQKRLRRYIEERERLFTAISHDLKTPITRLRLRAELIEDEQRAIKFDRDLDELEMMVKGALQIVKDTDIHENIEKIDVISMLRGIAEHYNLTEQTVEIKPCLLFPFACKPLAIKRCLTNIIDNGVKYGKRVVVNVWVSAESLELTFDDEGPGIPEAHIKDVFKPYFRLSMDKDGNGLGMGIAKSIIHAHGGDLTIRNRFGGGLHIKVTLPQASFE